MPISTEPIKKDSVLKAKDIGDSKGHIKFFITEPRYTFADMVIENSVLDQIKNAVSVFEYRDKLFDKWNLDKVMKKPVNICMNFYGPSGTGKSMAAHSVADMLGLKILQVNYADIESKYVGETSKNLSRLFEEASVKNVLLLFDEADALLSHRVTDMSSSTDVSVNQTRSVLLNLLDTFEGVLVFTTNFISNYDSAFMRRIPYHIKFYPPGKEMLIKMLAHYLEKTTPNNVDYELIADKYLGVTGSDISNALLTSSLSVARAGTDFITNEVFEDAIENILKSKEDNNPKVISVEERSVTEDYVRSQIHI